MYKYINETTELTADEIVDILDIPKWTKNRVWGMLGPTHTGIELEVFYTNNPEHPTDAEIQIDSGWYDLSNMSYDHDLPNKLHNVIFERLNLDSFDDLTIRVLDRYARRFGFEIHHVWLDEDHRNSREMLFVIPVDQTLDNYTEVWRHYLLGEVYGYVVRSTDYGISSGCGGCFYGEYDLAEAVREGLEFVIREVSHKIRESKMHNDKIVVKDNVQNSVVEWEPEEWWEFYHSALMIEVGRAFMHQDEILASGHANKGNIVIATHGERTVDMSWRFVFGTN